MGARKYLNAIAGRNNHGFVHAFALEQRLDRFRQLRLGDGEPLAHLNRCSAMVDAGEDEVHQMLNLWKRLNVFAAQAKIAITKAKVARNAARRPRHPELQRVYSRSMYTAHSTNDSTILGSVKNAAPYFWISKTEPVTMPKVMKGKPNRSAW